MRIPFRNRIGSSFERWIFFLGLYFTDLLSHDRRAGCARVDALRLKSGTDYKKPNDNC